MLVALTVNVEISDQYGTSENKFVGIFDDPDKLQQAKMVISKKYITRRNVFTSKEVTINEIIQE